MKIAKLSLYVLPLIIFLVAGCKSTGKVAIPEPTDEVIVTPSGTPTGGTTSGGPLGGGPVTGGTVTPAPTMYKLTVNLTGNGGVSMTSAHLSASFRSPAPRFEGYVQEGDVVTITSTPDDPLEVAAYSGACGGIPCAVTMDREQTVNITFGPAPIGAPVLVTLNAALNMGDCPRALLTSDSGGISCGTECRGSYSAGTTVMLELDPTMSDTHCEIKSWDVVGADPCSAGPYCYVLLRDTDTDTVTVTANLGLKKYTLTVKVSGMGDVDIKAGGISIGNCTPTACAPSPLAPFAPETAIMLEALPMIGYGFIGWEGEGITCPAGPPFRCNFLMVDNMVVTAKFSGLTAPGPIVPPYAPEYKYPFRNDLTPPYPGGPHGFDY